jgi:hypothetical protein
VVVVDVGAARPAVRLPWVCMVIGDGHSTTSHVPGMYMVPRSPPHARTNESTKERQRSDGSGIDNMLAWFTDAHTGALISTHRAYVSVKGAAPF